MKQLFCCLLCGLICLAAAQGQVALSGNVYELESREALPLVRITIRETGQVTFTNAYGYFSVAVRIIPATLLVQASGYQADTLYISSPPSGPQDIFLQPWETEIDGVTITAPGSLKDLGIGRLQVPVASLTQMPSLGGETDLMRAIQLLPGIQGGNEASSGLHIRGGSPDQTLLLLDGIPIYNANHLLGVLSVFNTDAIKAVDIYKGGFPARYGGRLSGILDITMKEGDQARLHGSGTLGLISSRAMLEGPIVKGKSSFLISGRRSFWDLVAGPVQRLTNEPEVLSYFFYDFTAKIQHQLGPSDHLYVSAYAGRDRFASFFDNRVIQGADTFQANSRYSLAWGNLSGAVRWTHRGKKRWFNEMILYHTRYEFEVEDRYDLRQKQEQTRYFLRFQSDVQDLGLRSVTQIQLSSNQTIRMGAGGVLHQYAPGGFSYELLTADSIGTSDQLSPATIGAQAWHVFIEDNIRLGRRISANVGLRLDGFGVRDSAYLVPQPRISLAYEPADRISLQVSYSSMVQFLHLLTNSTVSLPIDLWVPATDKVPFQRSWQVSAGVAYALGDGWDMSLEGYYKEIDGVIEYMAGANTLFQADPQELAASATWEDQVVAGRGWSYGTELLLRKQQGKWTGWLSYTLAFHNRQFPDLNQGLAFPYKYDRRHDIGVVLGYQWRKNCRFDLTWVFQTGQTGTIATTEFYANPQITGTDNQWYAIDYGSRNSYRFPPYHRLDLGFTLDKDKANHRQTFKAGLYNAYNRQNPFAIRASNNPGYPALFQSSLFPILPALSYQWNF